MLRRLLSLGLPLSLLALAASGCYARGLGLFAAGAVVGAAVASHPHEEVVVVEAPPPPPPPAAPPPAPPPPPAADPAPPPPPVPATPQPLRFDAREAHAALGSLDLSSCEARGVPAGARVHAVVTFAPGGDVRRALIDEPAGLSPDAVQCLAEQVTTARAPAWESGGDQSVEHRWTLR